MGSARDALVDMYGEGSSFASMSGTEAELFTSIIKEEILRRQNAGKVEQIREIVPIERWINSPYYVGNDVNRIYPYWKNLICDIFSEDRDYSNNITQLILGGSIGVGKSCLCEDTLVPTSLGLLTLKEIKSRFDRGIKFSVLSESGARNCVDVYDNGVDSTKILYFKSGRTVEGTDNHKFRIVRDGKIEWVRFGDVVVGDTTIMKRDSYIFGPRHVEEDYAYSLGMNIKDIEYHEYGHVHEFDRDSMSNFLHGVFRSSGFIFDDFISIDLESYSLSKDIGNMLSMFGIDYLISEGNIVISDTESMDRFKKDILGYKIPNIYYGGYYFDEVVDIEDGMCHTLDLEVEEDHSYCFNGFISHNTCAELVTLRKLYELSCYKNVNAMFNLMSKTNIMFFYFSINKTQAESTGFGELRSFVDHSPYFRDHFRRRERIDSLLVFPEGITVAYGSRSSDSIGMSVICQILDEANFAGGNGSNSSGNAEKALDMYAGMVNRASSRFIIDGGKNHSMNILVSSATHESSATERQIALSRDDPHTLVAAPSQWEVKPEKFSKEYFYVLKGTNYLEPQIVESVDDINNFRLSEGLKREKYLDGVSDYDTIESEIKKLPPHLQDKFLRVPVDLKRGFQVNIIRSLQDLGGVSIGSTGKLFNSPASLNECIDSHMHHPFIQQEFVISTGDNVQIKDYLRNDFRLRHPERPRYLHIDQSTTSDSTGISCVYVYDVEVDEESGMLKPIIGVDFMLRINPPKPPKKIAIYKIRNFIVWLGKSFGMNIGKLSYDIFNSEESRQILEEMGFNVKYRSVDRSDKAYLDLVEIIYEGRLRLYDYPILKHELFNLIHYRDKRKVDHPKVVKDSSYDGKGSTEGSKDVSDSVAGAIANLLEDTISNASDDGHSLGEFLDANRMNTLWEPDAMSVDDMIDRQIEDFIEEYESIGVTGGFGIGF